MLADLHLHSTFSDGSLTPEEIVAQAAGKGLAAIAITDHDSVDGVDPAKQAATKLATGDKSLQILSGIEISTEQASAEIHLLGYNLDHRAPELLELLAELRRARWGRALAILEKLKKLDKHLTPEEITPPDEQAAVGRLHIAKALVNKGLVGSVEEAFSLYLNTNAPAYVPHQNFTPAEAIAVINKYGGLSFLAHPGVSRCDHLIPGMLLAGLNGLEVFYPRHSQEQVSHYLQLARKNGLLVSGGSDFHGQWSNLYPAEIGRTCLSDKYWIPLNRAATGVKTNA